jgi:hypothetical protein
MGWQGMGKSCDPVYGVVIKQISYLCCEVKSAQTSRLPRTKILTSLASEEVTWLSSLDCFCYLLSKECIDTCLYLSLLENDGQALGVEGR